MYELRAGQLQPTAGPHNSKGLALQPHSCIFV